MDIKTDFQHIESSSVQNIYPPEFLERFYITSPDGRSERLTIDGQISARLTIIKKIESKSDLGGYLFQPEIKFTVQSITSLYLNSPNIKINNISNINTYWNIEELNCLTGVTSDFGNQTIDFSEKPLDTWIPISPKNYSFFVEVPQRGRNYALKGYFNFDYQVTLYQGNQHLYGATFPAFFEFTGLVSSESLEKSIFNPLYVNPNNTPIDPEENEINFNMQFSGEMLNTYYTEIFDNEDNHRVYPSESTSVTPIPLSTPLYNGEELDFTISNTAHNLEANKKYKWHNVLSRYSYAITEDNLVERKEFLPSYSSSYYLPPSILKDNSVVLVEEKEYIQPTQYQPDRGEIFRLPLSNFPQNAEPEIRIKFRILEKRANQIWVGFISTENLGTFTLNLSIIEKQGLYYFLLKITPPNTGFNMPEWLFFSQTPINFYLDNFQDIIYDFNISFSGIYDNIQKKFLTEKRENNYPFTQPPSWSSSVMLWGSYVYTALYYIQLRNHTTEEILHYYVPCSYEENTVQTVQNGFIDKASSAYPPAFYTPSVYNRPTSTGSYSGEEYAVKNYSYLSQFILGYDYDSSTQQISIGQDSKMLSGINVNLDFPKTNYYTLRTKFRFYYYPAHGGQPSRLELISFINTPPSTSSWEDVNYVSLSCSVASPAMTTLRFSISKQGKTQEGNLDYIIRTFATISLTDLIDPASSGFDSQKTYFEIEFDLVSKESQYSSNVPTWDFKNIKLNFVTPSETRSITTTEPELTDLGIGYFDSSLLFNVGNLFDPSAIPIVSGIYRSLLEEIQIDTIEYETIDIGGVPVVIDTTLQNLTRMKFLIDNETNQIKLYDWITKQIYSVFPLVYYKPTGLPEISETTKYLQYPKFETIDYGFFTYDMPELIYKINNVEIEDITSWVMIDSLEITVEVDYSQNQEIGVKYYSYILKDSEGNIIIESEDIYSANIKIFYSGLISGENYFLSFKLVTQANQILNQNIKLNASYNSTHSSKVFRFVPINSLGCVVITSLGRPISSNLKRIIFYRKESGKNFYEIIYDLSVPLNSSIGNFCFIDYGVKNNTTYSYRIMGMPRDSETYVTLDTNSENITTDFTSFYLLGLNQKTSNLPYFQFNSFKGNENFSNHNSSATINLQDNIFTYIFPLNPENLQEVSAWRKLEKGDYFLFYPVFGSLKDDLYAFKVLSILKIESYSKNNILYQEIKLKVERSSFPSEPYQNNFEMSIGSSGCIEFYFKILKTGENKPWVFSLNCEESELTFNQDKTFVNTFAAFPKFSMGLNSYYSGSLTALLSDYSASCLEDNTNRLEHWKKFLKKYEVCLYKNLKGDVKIVALDSNTNQKYMNEIANYYKEDDMVNAYPTTVSFKFVEIQDIKFLEGVEDLSDITLN